MHGVFDGSSQLCVAMHGVFDGSSQLCVAMHGVFLMGPHSFV